MFDVFPMWCVAVEQKYDGFGVDGIICTVFIVL